MDNDQKGLSFSSVQRLHERGLRPTPQRVAVFTYLCSYTSHPTAEKIYCDLISGYPTLSRTTVYQTLDALCKCGLVTRLVSDEGEMRFDAETSNHGHFKCVKCGRLYNFFYPAETVFPQPMDGFVVEAMSLYYKGVCPQCHVS
ncbi:MAG: transcriptional repressor [Kiritimatiellaeota bacterium]|nr:transcriptional repressor [Kiritimatiellota bacterium]